MLTKIEIIEETISYYKINPRSLSSNEYRCLYNGPNGEKCAFSRCCTDDSVFEEDLSSEKQIAAKLLPQYFHIPYDNEFWICLQSLHDTNSNWDGNDLTPRGINIVNDLKERFK